MKPMEYGAFTEVDLPFPCALTRTKEALLQHGFDVLSETGIDSPRTVIFAMNGCEVMVCEDACGGVTVAATGDREAGERLDAVMDWLRPCAVSSIKS
jgi:hypothetical protein